MKNILVAEGNIDGARETFEEQSPLAASKVSAALADMLGVSARANRMFHDMEKIFVDEEIPARGAVQKHLDRLVELVEASTGKARDIAEKAVRKATQASNRVQNLGEAADAIGKVTATITAISSQTNLLALNATIEAARAGDAGRGFAFVANEIKELAQQTARATDEIRGKIYGIQEATGMTVSEIDETYTVINEVNDIVGIIAAAVEEQTSSTGEIAASAGQTSSELVCADASGLSNTALKLQDLVAHFRLETAAGRAPAVAER